MLLRNILHKLLLEILQLRLSGLTLKEIGEKFDLSRERIRQIIEREYRRLLISEKRDRIKTAKDGHEYILFLKRDISKRVLKRLHSK